MSENSNDSKTRKILNAIINCLKAFIPKRNKKDKEKNAVCSI